MPERPRRPSIPGRFGLPDGDPWIGVPRRLLVLLRDRQVEASHRIVLLAILEHWRPDAGTVFGVSLTDLALATGLSRTTVKVAIQALAEAGLLHYFCGAGKTRELDLEPLLAEVRSVQGTSYTLSTFSPQVLHKVCRGRHSTVPYTDGSVPWPASNVEPQELENESEELRARAREGSVPSAPAPNDQDGQP